MVHKYSPAALQRRRERAVARGYVQAKVPGTTFVQVPVVIAESVKTMAAALVAHRGLDISTGCQHHYLADAALHARPMISSEAFHRAMRLNKEAGRAKHDVSGDVVLASAPAAAAAPRRGRPLGAEVEKLINDLVGKVDACAEKMEVVSSIHDRIEAIAKKDVQNGALIRGLQERLGALESRSSPACPAASASAAPAVEPAAGAPAVLLPIFEDEQEFIQEREMEIDDAKEAMGNEPDWTEGKESGTTSERFQHDETQACSDEELRALLLPHLQYYLTWPGLRVPDKRTKFQYGLDQIASSATGNVQLRNAALEARRRDLQEEEPCLPDLFG